MAPAVEKKIVDLEMGLLHLQQNIDIPEISLPIHQTVSSVIKKCAEEGRKPKVEDFGDKVEDAQFLNALQSGVNRWIREIQKVWLFILRLTPRGYKTVFMLISTEHEIQPIKTKMLKNNYFSCFLTQMFHLSC